MPKSIHERVRATLEKAERAKQKAADRAQDREYAKLVRADERLEKRHAALRDGTVQPATAEEYRIAWGEDYL